MSTTRRQQAPIPHGTITGYNYYRCSCDACRRAKADAQRAGDADRRRRLPEMFDQLPHGSISTYRNWGCRCDPCTAEQARNLAAKYEERKLRLARNPDLVPHGRAATYKGWGCRCDPCYEANRLAERKRKVAR